MLPVGSVSAMRVQADVELMVVLMLSVGESLVMALLSVAPPMVTAEVCTAAC